MEVSAMTSTSKNCIYKKLEKFVRYVKVLLATSEWVKIWQDVTWLFSILENILEHICDLSPLSCRYHRRYLLLCFLFSFCIPLCFTEAASFTYFVQQLSCLAHQDVSNDIV